MTPRTEPATTLPPSPDLPGPVRNGPPELPRYAELEAYRGMAALLVVVFHAYQYTREGTGAGRYLYEGTPLHVLFYNLDTPVAWFYALSGFLLFMPYARSIMQGKAPQRGRWFLFRRAVRILPLYLLAISVVWALRYGGQPGTWTDLLEHLTFTHVWDSRYIFYTIGPAWSLGNEVIFYAMLAIMGPALFRLTRQAGAADRRRWLLGFPLGLIALSVGYKLFMHLGLGLPASGLAWFFNPFAHADTFGMGMLLASLAATGWAHTGAGARAALQLTGVVLLALTFVARLEEPVVRIFAFTLSGLAFSCVLASTILARQPAGLARTLNRPGWATLGMMSYGLYLWHEPLMLELAKHQVLIRPDPGAFWPNALVLTLVAGAVAALTYSLVEAPAQQLRHLFTSDGRFRDGYAEAKAQYEREVALENAGRPGPQGDLG
ncbi:acyltransferase family protein [Deinococcus hohokamensis]|uniref:Acyltransferase family protein n=1 Tax=Deinococcus hohokamensis TaxID=309883 RepID=A0ABV9IA31_9DEIO